jgi:6-phosphogluconolactonase (cycloisomerase 2 family)
MKFRLTGRIALALLVSLAVGLGISACGSSYTLGFVYAISGKNNPGAVFAYKIDSDSGALTFTKDRQYPAGQLPVAAVVSPGPYMVSGSSVQMLYVVNNGDNTIINYAIGSDGKLFAQHTVNTAGTSPVAAAVDKAGKFLYVADTFAPGFSSSLPGPGQIDVFAIGPDGSIPTTPTATVTAGLTPTGITVLPNGAFVYVVQQGTQTIGAYSVGSSGALTPLATNIHAGIQPFAIAADPTGRFVYATDSIQNLILGYVVQTAGDLVPMINGPFRTDLRPRGLVVDPRGKFLYTANFNANNVGAYAIDQTTGNPTAVTPSSNSTGAGPTCVAIEPATGRFVYISNFIDGTITGAKLNNLTGVLVPLQNSPYGTGTIDTTCVAAVASGSHAVQNVLP